MTADINRDRKTDIICAGNFYGVTPYEGRYDAGAGTVLMAGHSYWKALTPLQSGLMVAGEVRDIKKLKTTGGKSMYVFARNNSTLCFYRR